MPIAISVAAILAGFQAASQSAMLTLMDAKTISYLKRIDEYKPLIKYLWASVFWLILFIIFALVTHAYAINIAVGSDAHQAWIFVALSLFAIALIASLRVSRLIIRIMMSENTGKHERPPLCSAGQQAN